MWPNLPWEISTCACGWTALYPWNAETPVFVWAIDVYVYSSELWRLEFRACDCVSMWGPAPSGYMSSSTPSRTRRRRVSSCMCTGSVEGQQPAFSRKRANEQLALRVSPDKQMVTVCTQGKCYQAVIISQAAICPPNRSQKGSKGGRRGEEKKALSFPSPNRHPVKSYVWFSFLSVPWRVHAVILCECHSFFSLHLYLFAFVFPSYLNLPPPSFLSSDSGADDLLPILSYVALRCQCPQLVSECAALEEFIHEGWVIRMESDDVPGSR